MVWKNENQDLIDELLEQEREFDEIEVAKEVEEEMEDHERENDWTAELKHIELAINENDAPWEDFFVADKKGRKWHGWRIHHALTIDGQTIEVIIPHGDISKLKFVLRGG